MNCDEECASVVAGAFIPAFVMSIGHGGASSEDDYVLFSILAVDDGCRSYDPDLDNWELKYDSSDAVEGIEWAIVRSGVICDLNAGNGCETVIDGFSLYDGPNSHKYGCDITGLVDGVDIPSTGFELTRDVPAGDVIGFAWGDGGFYVRLGDLGISDYPCAGRIVIDTNVATGLVLAFSFHTCY